MSVQNQNTGTTEDPNPLVGWIGTYFRPKNSTQHYELSIPFGLQKLLEKMGNDDLTKLHLELNEVCDLFTEFVLPNVSKESFARKYKVLRAMQGFVNDLFIKIEMEHKDE